jgi:hypothetical protein
MSDLEAIPSMGYPLDEAEDEEEEEEEEEVRDVKLVLSEYSVEAEREEAALEGREVSPENDDREEDSGVS